MPICYGRVSEFRPPETTMNNYTTAYGNMGGGSCRSDFGDLPGFFSVHVPSHRLFQFRCPTYCTFAAPKVLTRRSEKAGSWKLEDSGLKLEIV